MDRTEIVKALKVQQELKQMSKVSILSKIINIIDGLPFCYKVILSMTIGFGWCTACIHVLTH